ncbi:MAG TPA: ABC transporter permease [Bacteroidales bacterium]|nr:ABC transporter permease [Bacteroidales bacterium]
MNHQSDVTIRNYVKAIWNYRYLTYSLGIGDIKKKYSLRTFGVFFSVLQVVITLVVYWAIFGVILGVGVWGIPYPLFALPGIIMWQFFSATVGSMNASLHNSSNLISKLYFPRINLLISRLIITLPDLLIGLAIYFLLLLYYNQSFIISWLWILPLIFYLILVTFGVGLWLSIVSLYHKQTGDILLQLVSFCFFITPVFYPGTIVPEHYKILMNINPMAAVIDVFRESFFISFPKDNGYIMGFILGLLLFASSCIFFMRIEKKIADLL